MINLSFVATLAISIGIYIADIPHLTLLEDKIFLLIGTSIFDLIIPPCVLRFYSYLLLSRDSLIK